VPAGVDEGTRLRIPGEGEAGDRGASRGDLYVIIRLKKHKFFEREGNNLYSQISISFVQAALGATVEIPTLEKNELLHIPPGIQAGSVLKIKGKGLKTLGSKKFAELRGENPESIDRSIISKVKNIFH